MSPRCGSAASTSSTSVTTRSASAPYPRRPAGQPKSSRQQFSACGACRMRRVRCDLKDLPIGSTGPHPACSNCKERGLKCVDEFADVKAVKLLRRGRRLQQVEAIYGKVGDSESVSSKSRSATRLSSIIPTLHTEFFASPFWHWFSMQRPVLDPTEFPARFFAHTKGTQTFGHEAGLIATLLVVWATSFGVDERGIAQDGDSDIADSPLSEPTNERPVPAPGGDPRSSGVKNSEITTERKRRERKERTDAMIREVLELIDFHGVMRRPTWDGVRVLLLILPLLEDAHPLERLAIHEATLSQTQALCTLATSSPGSSSLLHPLSPLSDDAATRARIFWYAHMHEGMSSGMRGGRLVLNTDDLESFQRTLPTFGFGSGNMVPSSFSSANMNGHFIHPQRPHSQRGSPPQSYLQLTQLFSIPLMLGNICRKVHAVLTGPKATRRAEDHGLIDAHGMRDIWEDLDRCWEEFDTFRKAGLNDTGLDIELYVGGWQIFIFECHNTIRESLKQCMSNMRPTDNSTHSLFSAPSSPRPSSHSSNSSPYVTPHYLHAIATRTCFRLLPCALSIIKFHLSRQERNPDGPGLFRWDAGLVRDGCFFAGFMAASMEGDTFDDTAGDRDFKQEDGRRLDAEEGVALCLAALAEMRWGFSKSEERAETIRMVWDNRNARRHGQYNNRGIVHTQELDSRHYIDDTYGGRSLHHSHTNAVLPGADRPLLPPLTLAHPHRRIDSAPNTGCSADGNGASGWPSYTPPGTATSVTTSTGTGISARGSPVFHGLTGPGQYKANADDTFYHVAGDLDQFSFSAPASGPLVGDPSMTVASYHRPSSTHSHPLHDGNATSTYLDPAVFGPAGSSLLGHPTTDDINVCPQFGDDCNGFYH